MLDQKPETLGAKVGDVDASVVASLVKSVNEDGYVIIPDLISPEIVDRIRDESAPFLTYNGRNEIEGHLTRRI